MTISIEAGSKTQNVKLDFLLFSAAVEYSRAMKTSWQCWGSRSHRRKTSSMLSLINIRFCRAFGIICHLPEVKLVSAVSDQVVDEVFTEAVIFLH